MARPDARAGRLRSRGRARLACPRPRRLHPRGHPLWVVRGPTSDAARAFLEEGYAALAEPGRRSAKARRQLEAFSAGVRPGDLVGLPLDGGSHLVLGEVTGPHREARSAGGGVEHRRDVRWYGELPRSAVHPSALLQDPRSFFLVHLAEDAEGVEGPEGDGGIGGIGAEGVRARTLSRG